MITTTGVVVGGADAVVNVARPALEVPPRVPWAGWWRWRWPFPWRLLVVAALLAALAGCEKVTPEQIRACGETCKTVPGAPGVAAADAYGCRCAVGVVR